mgnify:CR=1 FL=1
MKKTIFDFEKKYEVQDELLNEGALEGLDERTLHETIKAMLINTIKDCIKYENWMDPDMTEISKILFKEKKTEDDMRKIKNAQDRLRNSLHFSKISEESLYTLLFEMLSSDYIKQCFKQDIPKLYENLYYMIDMEEEIAESLTFIFAELYNAPSYKEICAIINNNIEDFIDNAEEYIDDIQKHDLYDQFVNFRDQINSKEKENVNE